VETPVPRIDRGLHRTCIAPLGFVIHNNTYNETIKTDRDSHANTDRNQAAIGSGSPHGRELKADFNKRDRATENQTPAEMAERPRRRTGLFCSVSLLIDLAELDESIPTPIRGPANGSGLISQIKTASDFNSSASVVEHVHREPVSSRSRRRRLRSETPEKCGCSESKKRARASESGGPATRLARSNCKTSPIANGTVSDPGRPGAVRQGNEVDSLIRWSPKRPAEHNSAMLKSTTPCFDDANRPVWEKEYPARDSIHPPPATTSPRPPPPLRCNYMLTRYRVPIRFPATAMD